MNDFIPLSIPNLSGNELKYVTEAITDGWISTVGPHVTKFESAFAEYVNAPYAVSCMNGTAALHISMLLCGVEPEDEVIVPNLTFVATLNAVKYCYAHPVLMDSEWTTLGMDVSKVSDFLKTETYSENGFCRNKKTKRRIKAIIPMHTLGYPVDMDPLIKIAEQYNIDVIEDSTESLGSTYKGTLTGNFGKLGCFSFNGNKIMSTGGGGMIVTHDEQLARRAKHLTTTAKTDPIEYDHDEVGYNYRMVNVLAAIGIAQLEQMPGFVETKRKNLALYKELINGKIPGMHVHEEASYSRSNYWMYSLVLDKQFKHSVRELVNVLAEHKIQTRPIWKLMNMLPMYASCQAFQCDVSKDIYERTISLPCSTSLTAEQIHRVVKVLANL